MGSNWKICELDKVIKKRNQGVNTTTEKVKYSSEGIIVIRANNILSGRIDYRDCAFVDEETFSRIKDTCKPRKGDVLYTNIGSQFGTAVKVNVDFEFAIAWNVLRIQTSNEVDSDFLVYLLNNPVNKRYIQSLNSSSTMPFVSGKVVGGVAFKFPSIAEQIKIKNVLKPFEHRIELNRQTNQTLEQIAQALFKSWFVDFDPVFDNLLASVDFNLDNLETSLPDQLKQKAQRRLAALNSLENAAQYKASLSALAHELQAQLPTKEATQSAVQVSEKAAETPVKANFNTNPNILAQHANTHAHFPNEFEHNEQLGWIPKGWSVDKAEKVADIAIGKTPPRKQKEWFSDNPLNNKVWVSIKDMGGNKTFIGDSSEYLTSESISKFNVKVVPKDSVILSFKLTLGRVCITKCDLTTNEAIAHFVNPKFSMSKEYIYLYLKCFDYGSLGSTSSIATAVNSKIIKAMPFLVPNKTVLSSFKGSIENIFFKMDTLGSESTSLTKLRDTLLPKLISGELQIPGVTTDEEVVD